MYDAQSELEMRQKAEEDHLYSQIHAQREELVRRIEAELDVEKEKSVKDMAAGLDRAATRQDKGGLAKETQKLEAHYRYVYPREDKVK